MIKLAINGCCGKMGSRITELAISDVRFEVVIGLEQKGHREINRKIKNILISSDTDSISRADVAIDFTTPVATMSILAATLKSKKAIVIGTTGLTNEQVEKIEQASKVIPVVFSPNMSVGVNLLFRLVKEAAAKLKGYKIDITEAHHIHKKDSPSGTAKKLAEVIKLSTGKDVENIKSIREDGIIGDHQVSFESDLDIVVLSHSAKTRDIFATGALEAAAWVANQPTGLYTMQDVLT